jgi:hypothetical protein
LHADARTPARLTRIDRGFGKHPKKIFDSGELAREATVSKIEIVRAEDDREVARDMEFYNLDAIIDVGCRINSFQATQFRIRATKTLREFMIKGFVLDDDPLIREDHDNYVNATPTSKASARKSISPRISRMNRSGVWCFFIRVIREIRG